MPKALRTAAVIVGGVALLATGVGALGSIGAFGTLSVAGTATLATVSSIATIASVAAAGLAIGATLATKRPGQAGSPTQFTPDPQSPVPYLMGRTSNAGRIVYWKEHDTKDKGDNDRQTFVVILSGGGPVEAVESFSSDAVVTSFDGSGNAAGFYAGWMWMKTQLGLTPQPTQLSIAGDPYTPPGWTAAHRLSGYCAAMWRNRWDTKGAKYTNGTPKPNWVVRGVKVYDPRLDSTYPGGAGACRALDESTYVYSENPFLHGLTWVLGRWQNGKRILGIGAPIAGIDVGAYVEGANVADANGWKVGGVAYSTDNKWETLVSILQAGMGEPIAMGAKISCFVNAPKVSLDTIRIGDLAGAASVTATKPIRDRINEIIPRYRSEAHNWEVISAAPVSVPDYIAMDSGVRRREADYPFIQDLDQAAVAARYGIENAREFEPISLPLRVRWIGYKPGDCVTVDLPELGLNGQSVLITNRDIDPGSGLPTMRARSETPAKHPFALGQTTIAPADARRDRRAAGAGAGGWHLDDRRNVADIGRRDRAGAGDHRRSRAISARYDRVRVSAVRRPAKQRTRTGRLPGSSRRR